MEMKVPHISRETDHLEESSSSTPASRISVGDGTQPLHIAIVLRDFNTGGANALAEMLGRGLREAGCRVTYILFYGGDGNLEMKAQRAGFQIEHLGKQGRWDLTVVLRLVRMLRKLHVDVVYAMLPLSNIVCVTAKPLLPSRCRVIATIHNESRRDLATLSWPARAGHWLNLRVVRWADHVIVNSPQAMAELRSQSGIPARRVTLVPNGVDLIAYQRDDGAAAALDRQWKTGPADVLFGLVTTRLDHVKGHDVFLQAAAVVAARLPESRFVCLGTGDSGRTRALKALAGELGIDGRVIWAGRRTDMPAVYSALDVLVVASFNEGGPNVIAEAMACGTPCVSTEVGCAREMIGGTGRVVPVGNAAALAEAMEEVAHAFKADPSAVRRACREQITQGFGMTRYIEQNLAVLQATSLRRATR
jgi:glycosyltransferase involved in cell wall biosynthesis